MYYFLPRKSIFACISTFGEDWICTFESSNPYTWLKQPNVIYENRSKIFEIWVAKKPDISGFFCIVIHLVMTIWQGQKDLNPRHAVLETAALPTELYPYVVGLHGLEPWTDRL